MYLLDTNIVSELRKPKPHGGVVDWIGKIPGSALFLCAVTLAEIQTGIERTREQDAAKANSLEAWLDQLAIAYNVLPLDGKVFREWARMMHKQSDTLY